MEKTDLWDSRCIVCDKSVTQGGGYSHFKFGNRMIALFCPLCWKTFEKDPQHYCRMTEIQSSE